MDDTFLQGFRVNHNIYNDSLDRIIEKYSKFQHLGEEFAVDLSCIHPKKLQKRLRRVENTLCDTSSLSKSQTDLDEAWNNSQDITSGAELDTTHEDGVMDESVSLSHSPADASEMSGHQTQLSLSSLEDSQKDFLDVELQPEEQNEELQMSLSSNGSSLMDIYPSMINRIEQAWHRQHVSLTASAVLKRYRRWRKKLNKSTLSNSSVVSNTSSTDKNPKEIIKNTRLRNPSGPVTRSAAKESPLKAVTVIPCKRSQRKQCRPITVIDLSDSDISLNETITMSEQSPPDQDQNYIQDSFKTVSPAHPVHLAAKASLSPMLKYKGLPTARDSMCTSDSVRRSSPVKQSPLKVQLMTSLSQSPHNVNKTPLVDVMEHDTKSPFRTKWRFSSFSSPSQNLCEPLQTPEISLNETITVSEQSLPDQDQSYIQDSWKTASPAHPVHLATKASMSPLLKYKRLQSLSQTADIPSVKRSPPVRQSPLKVQLMTGLSQSPHTLNNIPVLDVMELNTHSPFRTKWRFSSFSSPSQNVSGPSKTPEISLNETITMSEQSFPDQDQSYIQDSFKTVSPAHPVHLATKASLSPMLKYNGLPTARDSMCTSDSVRRSSPVKQSPLKVQLMTSLSQSPHKFNKTPAVDVMEHDTKSPFRTKWRFSSFSSPSQNLCEPLQTPEISLNETITVSEQSLPDQDQSYIQDSWKTASPAHPVHSATKASMSPLLKYKRLQSLSQTADIPSVKRSPPVRQSPLKVQLMTSLSQSPHTLNKTPVVDVMEHYTKSPFRTKLQFSSFSSPSQHLSVSGSSKTPEVSLNETFTVSEQSLPDHTQSYIQDTLKTVSPAHLATKASMSPALKYKRLQSSSQSARDFMCTSDIPFVRRSFPARQSPLKWMTSLSQSPVEQSKSPTPNSQSSFSPQRPRALSRRHLSFDSIQPLAPLSPQQLDSEFKRVFHKYVCLNKRAPSQAHGCSLCASNHSSSVLAALALSPHCSNQRKRYRGDEPSTDPESKRFRVNRSMNLPGSKRLQNDNLRRCLYPAQPPCGTLPCFSRKVFAD